MATAGKRPICPISKIYNAQHFATYERDCTFRHVLFDWRAIIEGKATLIADSLCKWLKDTNYIDVQASPGLRLESALQHINKGYIQVQGFEYVLLAVGSNNIDSCNIQDIRYHLHQLIQRIRAMNPYVTIGLCSILPRPKDDDIAETFCKQVNMMFKVYCRHNGIITYLPSWKCMVDDNEIPKRGLYNPVDMLHLNDNGVAALKMYVEGALSTMVDDKANTE